MNGLAFPLGPDGHGHIIPPRMRSLVSWQAMWAVAGIACMFVLNLSVSFALSLFTAARAFDLPFADLLLVLRGIALRLLRRPHQFVLPPQGGRPHA